MMQEGPVQIVHQQAVQALHRTWMHAGLEHRFLVQALHHRLVQGMQKGSVQMMHVGLVQRLHHGAQQRWVCGRRRRAVQRLHEGRG